MTTTTHDLETLVALRRALHRQPELSGEEHATAERIRDALAGQADAIVTGLGGTGLAAVFDSGRPGPSVMFRAELDALPILETSAVPWRSQVAGRGHLCGHDGHMAILVGLAGVLARNPPRHGRVVLLFQPAEETGAGARAVLADPRFAALACDWAFALHNLPGVAQGTAWMAPGPANCASLGLVMALHGKTSHASVPEAGVSPAPALAELIPALSALGTGGAMDADYRLATVTHARLGERALGIAPGWAELLVTLRATSDAQLEQMLGAARSCAAATADRHGLALDMDIEDHFAACSNHPEASRILGDALGACAIAHHPGELPLRASEDFGLFATVSSAAMVFLGAGQGQPMLHNPDYDFPDALIAPGIAVFDRIVTQLTR
ncbi:MAG: Metal-dependent amidase/aminoacylase/carboxypeptidase [Rhodobacteraceae bacterium HLUCCA12]|nr:MAG: Metal-dependent amidase/aminoacylase/carboxypeptidase [Rhodobacteraceae bacterium HLUCCA12]